MNASPLPQEQTALEPNWDMFYMDPGMEYQPWDAMDVFQSFYLPPELSMYCLCDYAYYFPEFMAQTWLSKQNSQLDHKAVKGKVLSTENLELRMTYLLKALEEITDCDSLIVRATKKVQRRNRSTRRSSFIGVSRNGPNWQAMISINKRKSYIGTYSSEKEAAVAFDYYSVIIHGLSAKTNYSYTKPGLIDLIFKFKEQ